MIRRLALILRLGAIIFAISAFALLLSPERFLKFLGFDPEEVNYSVELLWAMRMIGACLLIASVMMPVVASFAQERALRQVGALMVGISALLTVLTLATPAPWGIGKALFIAVGGGFALAYLYGLKGRRRNH